MIVCWSNNISRGHRPFKSAPDLKCTKIVGWVVHLPYVPLAIMPLLYVHMFRGLPQHWMDGPYCSTVDVGSWAISGKNLVPQWSNGANSPTEIKTAYCAQWAMDMRDRKRCEWRVRECCHGRTLSLGVCVMKTGHSRAVGTVGAFAGVSAVSPCWLSAARVSRMSKEVGKLNRGGDVKWMSGAWFVKAGGKAAVTYHLKSSWRREQRGREGVGVCGFGNHCITFLQRGGRKSGEVGLHGVTATLQR